MSGGEVKFTFKGDDSDLTKKTNGISSKLGSAGKSIGSAFLKGTAVAGGALVGLVGKSVAMAGSLEQQLGGSEAVFKKYADTVQKTAESAYSKMGLSQNAYLETANKMGALMQGSGLSIKQSVDLSSQAMQRAADVASIMGIDINSAMESITGAAKGNFTMMDNLGVAMNATTIEAYALEQGLNKSWNEMTKAEQVGMAMQMFLDKTAYATGNYAKENETFAGSMQTMKASFENFMSGAGSIDSVIESTLSFANILVTSIGQMAPKITTGIVQLINGLLPQIPTLLQKLLPAVINGVVSLAQGIVSALPQVITTLASMLPTLLQSLISGLVQITNALAQQMPTLIPIIIDAVLGMIPVLIDNLPLFIQAGMQLIVGLASGIIKAVPTLLSYIPKILKSMLNYYKQLPKMLWTIGSNAIKKLGSAFVSYASWVVTKVKSVGKKVINGIKYILQPGNLLSIGKNLVKGLWNGINNAKDWVLSKIKGFGKAVLKGIKSIFGIKSPSKEMFIIGGYIDQGFIKGVESMKDDVNSAFMDTFDLSPSLYGSTSTNLSPNVNVVVNSTYKQDPLGQMVREVKTFSGGSKNDYNYGTGV